MFSVTRALFKEYISTSLFPYPFSNTFQVRDIHLKSNGFFLADFGNQLLFNLCHSNLRVFALDDFS